MAGRKIEDVVKTKYFVFLVFFVIGIVAFYALSSYFTKALSEKYKYELVGADTNADGEVGDVEGYAYLFGGMVKDIGNEVESNIKVGVATFPLDIKAFFSCSIGALIMLIGIAVNKKLRVFSNVALGINLLFSLISIFISFLMGILAIEIILGVEAVITLGLLIWNNKNTSKTKIDSKAGNK